MVPMTELAVLVPVLNRPQNVAPLVESFLAGCPGHAELWFIVNADDVDELEQIRPAFRGIERINIFTLFPESRSWPIKINHGTRHADADWFLCAADDVTFTLDWWEATKPYRDDPTIGVIGTNDSHDGSGNPAVAAGEHTCHPLIRATYIRDYGTWDGPGQAVCEEYHHWFVDNELVITAKMRSAWAFCREAVIEHHHPYWDPSIPWDDTYQLGEANAEADKQTWFRRSAQYGPLQPRKNDTR